MRAKSLAVAALVLVALGGCGSSHSGGQNGSSSGAGALSGEAQSAATGDIPDNQVFLTYHDRPAGFSLLYPEGWSRRGTGRNLTFADKNNVIHVVIASGSLPSQGTARAQLERGKTAAASVKVGAAKRIPLAAGPALKLVYTTRSSPNPVTGRRVNLLVDRYYVSRGRKLAIVDLGTPKGVDNVDAYRQIIHSFRWR